MRINSRVIKIYLSSGIAILAVLVYSPVYANNFGPKSSNTKNPVEGRPTQKDHPKQAETNVDADAFIAEVIPNKTNIKTGESIAFEYWVYVSVGADYEGLSKDLFVREHIVNMLLKRANGKMINSEDAFTGAPIFFDEQKKRLVSRDPVPNTPCSGLLKEGDILEAVNGEPVTDLDSALKIFRLLKAGVPSQFSIIRDSAKQVIEIIPRKYADDRHVYDQSSVISLNVIAEFDESNNILVAKSGPSLNNGDIINTIDGVKIRSLDQWFRIAGAPLESKEYLFSVIRNENELSIPIKATRQDVPISAEYIFPTTNAEVMRSEITLHGRRYVKARPLVINVRFGIPGEFTIEPGVIRMRGEIKQSGLFLFNQPKPVFAKQSNDLPGQPVAITVT